VRRGGAAGPSGAARPGAGCEGSWRAPRRCPEGGREGDEELPAGCGPRAPLWAITASLAQRGGAERAVMAAGASGWASCSPRGGCPRGVWGR